MTLSDDIYDDIRLYLKDDGFCRFNITKVHECIHETLKGENIIVYEFVLNMCGNAYDYRIQTKKVKGYAIRKSRKLKIKRLFKGDKSFKFSSSNHI
jgi:hypothetical protein